MYNYIKRDLHFSNYLYMDWKSLSEIILIIQGHRQGQGQVKENSIKVN